MKISRIIALIAILFLVLEPVAFSKSRYKSRSSSRYSSSKSKSSSYKKYSTSSKKKYGSSSKKYSSTTKKSSSYGSSKYSKGSRKKHGSFFNRKGTSSTPKTTTKSSKTSSSSSRSSKYSSKNTTKNKKYYPSTSGSTGFKNGRPITGSKADHGLSRAQKVKKAKVARKSYRETQKRFKKQSRTRYSESRITTRQRQTINSVRHRPGYNPYDYHYRRSVYLGGYSTPSYVYGYMSPRWGVWDTVMLMYILQQGSSYQRRLFYDNQNDQEIKAFRKELDKLSKDNQELKAQLERLEKDEAGWKREGVKPIEGRVPEDIGDLAFSPDVVETFQETPGILKIATGGASGLYFQFGSKLKECIVEKKTSLKVEVISTPGTIHNIDGLIENRYNAAIIQADGLDDYYIKNPKATLPSVQATLYKEKVFILVHDESGVDDLRDIHGNQDEVILMYGKGSGAELTFRNLGREDSGYKGFSYINKSGTAALSFLAQNKEYLGKKLAMITVIGMNSRLLQTANELYPDLKIIPYNDWDADDYTDRDGNSVYSTTQIPAIYNNLQPRGLFWGNDPVETVEVESVFFLSDQWVRDNSDTFDDVAECGAVAKKYIREIVKKR